MRKKLRIRTDANLRLATDTTTAFIEHLSRVIEDDVSIRGQYLKKYWLSKFADPSPESASKRRSLAIEKWLTTERRNSLTNSRLQSVSARNFMFTDGVTYAHLISTVRRMVARVIPWTPSLDIAYGGFSGGASTSKKRAEGHPALKFLGKADTTRCAWQLFQSVNSRTRWEAHLNESGLDPRYVSGNQLFTVPKNSEIDRCACKEPDINLFLQRMLGNQIRFCLRRVGIDLNDQDINGNLAREGSITGDLATVDLSAASDSVVTEAVRLLMPKEWFHYLSICRSPTTLVDGKVVNLEMFSSMGNGYTFELESLLFYSIARAVAFLTGTRGPISVFGDDIICPTEMTEELFRALSFFGFTTNKEKTFTKGDFRESCGSYWHAGMNVKPFFLKSPIIRVTDLVKILNQLLRWSSRDGGVADPRYTEVWDVFRVLIPEQYWGGQDLTSITSLVTGHPPRKRLSPVAKPDKIWHKGGLLNWMHSALSRTGLTESTMTQSRDRNCYECRRNRQPRAVDLPVVLTDY